VSNRKLSALALEKYPNASLEQWRANKWTDEQMETAGWLDPANEPTVSPKVTEPEPLPTLAIAEAAADAARGRMMRANQYKPGSAELKAAEAEYKAAWGLLAAVKRAEPKDPYIEALNPIVASLLRQSPAEFMFLPNDHFASVPVAARRIFSSFAASQDMYRRGSAVVELDADNRVAVVSATMFRARLNKDGRKTVHIKSAQRGELYPDDKLCSEDIAKVLLKASEVNLLPEIKLIVASPLLVEVDGKLALAQPGYNSNCGVLVTSNGAVWEVPLDEAVAALLDLLRDFQFPTRGDRSRGIAALIAPAVRMGRFLPGNALVDTVEADDSQAGKGTKHELTHLIYGEVPYPVLQKEGGVGSFDESLSTALMSGKPFIALDNLRGNLRSTLLEGAITPISGDKRVAVRVPHHGEVMVDAGSTLFVATSNGFSSTRDLANRLLVTRLRKQPKDYAYHQWGTLGLLQYVEKNALYFLSCVHAVIRHWHAAGKPKLPTTHTFKDWVGSLDWIAQKLFGAAPLLDGHENAALRIANPSLSWLRQAANAVVKEGLAGRELRASDIRGVCERNGCLPDGVKIDWDDMKIEPAIGRIMATCFAHADRVSIDSIEVTRMERKPADNGWKPTKVYVFALDSVPPPPRGA
jgi:hypothetical protein